MVSVPTAGGIIWVSSLRKRWRLLWAKRAYKVLMSSCQFHRQPILWWLSWLIIPCVLQKIPYLYFTSPKGEAEEHSAQALAHSVRVQRQGRLIGRRFFRERNHFTQNCSNGQGSWSYPRALRLMLSRLHISPRLRHRSWRPRGTSCAWKNSIRNCRTHLRRRNHILRPWGPQGCLCRCVCRQ